MEKELSDHIAALDDRFHGLNMEQCLKLAWEHAQRNKVQVPDRWNRNSKACEDWLDQFMRRCSLSIRTPEATSLARQSGFKKVVAAEFFKKLSDMMTKYQFGPKDIYNLDETGVTTAQIPGKLISTLGKRQVGPTVSQECGELSTLCCAVNAGKNYLPPFYILLRVFMKQSYLTGAVPGAKGVATKSGYMNLKYLLRIICPCSSSIPAALLKTQCS